jgi:hypothetical protein
MHGRRYWSIILSREDCMYNNHFVILYPLKKVRCELFSVFLQPQLILFSWTLIFYLSLFLIAYWFVHNKHIMFRWISAWCSQNSLVLLVVVRVLWEIWLNNNMSNYEIQVLGRKHVVQEIWFFFCMKLCLVWYELAWLFSPVTCSAHSRWQVYNVLKTVTIDALFFTLSLPGYVNVE